MKRRNHYKYIACRLNNLQAILHKYYRRRDSLTFKILTLNGKSDWNTAYGILPISSRGLYIGIETYQMAVESIFG